MNIHQARSIVDMVQDHSDTFPGETAEVRRSAHYIEAVDSLSSLYVMGACAFWAALGQQGMRPQAEEC